MKAVTSDSDTKTFMTDVRKQLASKFIYSRDVADVLSTGYLLQKNVILYGAPGHAKSDMVMYFFKEILKVKPYMITCSIAMSPEVFYGGVDLKAMRDHGRLMYLPQYSWMNHEYVIMEEGLDTPIDILAMLKQIETSKKFELGGQVFPVKTKMIVICTNRSKDEVRTDDSSAATLERFPLMLQVKWPSYTAVDFSKMFSTQTGRNNIALADMIERINFTVKKDRLTISPRTAMWMLEILEKVGPDPLVYIEGVTPSHIKQLKTILKEAKVLEDQQAIIDECLSKLIEIDTKILKLKGELTTTSELNPSKTKSLLEDIQHITATLTKQKWLDAVVIDADETLNCALEKKETLFKMTKK